MRAPSIHHCTSVPLHFFGRKNELRLLNEALAGGPVSLAAMVGPGGQGKTAIVQHWLETLVHQSADLDGIFLWSFYRGKDSDLCLREWFAYAERLDRPPEVSASFCVDRLLPRLRKERWAIVLDGTEVVQHDQGAWLGRFWHPELGRLLEELASEPMPGVLVATTRFPLPTLENRRHACLLSLSTLDRESSRALLHSLGVRGTEAELNAAAEAAGLHAKAVELLGTWLRHFHGGTAQGMVNLPPLQEMTGASSEEIHVSRILAGFHQTLPDEMRDILALATAFRQPAGEQRLLEYLISPPVEHLLHTSKGRSYLPFARRETGWLKARIQELVDLRLLERVGLALSQENTFVLDAHPLVRTGFEEVLGTGGHHHGARAGFLSRRPDRQPPQTLEEAREEVELFYAYCDAGLWIEADGTLAALNNPKHRFLAPAFERDLLLRFFPTGHWRQQPLWPGFGRYRSLAICFELLGQFDDALEAYRETDAPLQGDALLAIGRLDPLISQPHVAHAWQALWQAYRAHALCLQGQESAALALVQTLVPVDVYEWVHVFECLARLGKLQVLNLPSMLYRPGLTGDHRWSILARERMRADYLRLTKAPESASLGNEYRRLLEDYDRAGMPFERALTRLSLGRWLLQQGNQAESEAVARGAAELGRRHGMNVILVDALELLGEIRPDFSEEAANLRKTLGYHGPARP